MGDCITGHVSGSFVGAYDVPINCDYVAQAVAQDCVYSSGDPNGRSGQPCNSSDANDGLECIVAVNANDFRDEWFGWDWGKGCQNIQGTAGAGTAGVVGAIGALGSLTGIPGAAQIASLIASLINHGAAVHNTENTILCDVVPIIAYILGSIVQSFRVGYITAAQANQYMASTLVQARNAIGQEAGRGSGQGVLRDIAIVNAYFDRELPDEEVAAVAARSRIAMPGGVNSTTSASTLAPALVKGIPAISGGSMPWLLVAGAALVLFFVLA